MEVQLIKGSSSHGDHSLCHTSSRAVVIESEIAHKGQPASLTLSLTWIWKETVMSYDVAYSTSYVSVLFSTNTHYCCMPKFSMFHTFHRDFPQMFVDLNDRFAGNFVAINCCYKD